jgi:hypothetical protein
MRLQLIALLVAVPAAAQPGTTPPTTPPGPDAPPTDDELRDVFVERAPQPDPDASEPPTGTVRVGGYADSDKTTVLRTLGILSRVWDHWSATGSFSVDAVTSASVDVRASPALSAVDVVASASGRTSTSGGQMTDTRYQLTGGAGWNDTAGHTASVTAAAAKETDYASISGGLNGSYDVLDRSTTLLGGFTLTDNWVSSVLDPTLNRKMAAVAWSAGVARVLTPDDAIRVRYDGKLAVGDQSSPYRTVRFGDWTAHLGEQQIEFMNTIGSTDGLPERLPETRTSHAVVVEWVHSLASGVGLHPELRTGHDSWQINSLSAALDLRVARPKWRLQTGYRFYVQSRASFYESKYTDAPDAYTYYTSDKELGRELGHLLRFDVAREISSSNGPNDNRMMLDFQIDAAHYSYPGFVFLPSRDSVFASIGLSWEH